MKHESIGQSKISVFKFRAVVIIFILFAFAAAQGVVLPETAKLVGPETILLVNINNFTELNSQFEKTTLYKFYKDPAMTAFIEDIQKKFEEKAEESKDEITKGILDAEILPKGRLAVALAFGEQAESSEPSVLLISQWGENVGKIKETIDKQVSKAVEDDARRKSESFRSVDIVTIIKERPAEQVPDWGSYKPEHNDVPMKTFQPPPMEINYSFIDDCLVGSTDLEMLKFAIAHIQGAASASLADEVNYSPTMKAVGPYHDIDLYVNLKQIIKAAITGDPSGQAQLMMTNLGLDNITSLGFSVGLARRPDSSCSGKVLLKVNGAKKGICKMLDFESAVIRAPQFIPAEAYSTTFINLNIKNLYGELYNILSMFNPMIAAQLNQPLFATGPDGQGGLHLKADIIDHLGSNIVTATKLSKPLSDDSEAMPESVTALAINNRGALERSLSLLHEKITGANPDSKRELLGHTIYVVDLSMFLPFLGLGGGMTPMQLPGETGAPQIPKLAFTVTDTHLIFGSESTTEQVIRRLSSSGESVASAKWFTTAKLAIPSVVGLAWLQDNAASGEFFWRMLKKSAGTGQDRQATMGVTLGPNPGMIFAQMGLFDAGLLPEFGAVRKYFGPFTFYGISKSDGFFFEFNSLNPSGSD